MAIDLETIVNKVVDTLHTKTVIGEPMEVGGVTLIPVMNVHFGFGGGGGDGKPSEGAGGQGFGGGGGGRMKVAGMVVIQDGHVQFLPTSKGNALQQLSDAIPDLLETLKDKLGKRTDGDDNDIMDDLADSDV